LDDHQHRKVLLVGRTRSDLLSNYVNLVEKGGIVAPLITYPYTEHLYASVSDLYGSGHLPDSICSLALATFGVGVPVAMAVDVSPAEIERIQRGAGIWPTPHARNDWSSAPDRQPYQEQQVDWESA
jgi:hypothetical protein